MADINKIITELYDDAEVNECIRKFAPSHLYDDFKQEFFLRLLEHGEGLVKAYENGGHRYYCASVIVSLITRSRDVFHKKFSGWPEPLPNNLTMPDETDEGREAREAEELRLIERIDRIEQETGRAYYRMLIEAVMRLGSYREVSRQTGIPVSSISDSMKLIRNHLKCTS